MIFPNSLYQLRNNLHLNGVWSFVLDPNDEGIQNAWYESLLNQTIEVPSSWAEAGYGDAPNVHYLWGWNARHEYEGIAWYAQEIMIPEDWAGKHIELNLKGVRWRSRVWLDGHFVGECDYLSVSHWYDLSLHAKAGQKQLLSIQIDNRMLYPLEESHINSLQTATRWGGITGGIELMARPEVSIETVKYRANIQNGRFDFDVHLNQLLEDLNLRVRVLDPIDDTTIEAQSAVKTIQTSISVELGNHVHLWSDQNPHLYDVQFILEKNSTPIDIIEKRAGLREITIRGKQILINGNPVFLRGYVDCCIFPLTGYPSWDIDHYRRQFKIARSYGFNHVRLHSWTAPDPFWEAADECGMIVQTELPHWSKHYITGSTVPPEDTHQFLTDEMFAIIDNLNFHPSWLMFACGNELISPEGNLKLNEMTRQGKSRDSSRLFTDQAGMGRLPAPHREVDFFIQSCNWHPPKKIYDAASNDTTQDFNAITALSDRPVIGHEHGQFTMYVRPSEAEKYTGAIQPTWLDSINESFLAKGLQERVDDYIEASGIHIARTYKENIERARRTTDLAGFQLLDIRDFPGQAHATTGILDMFWDSKGIIEPEKFAKFNGSAVLLMRSESATFYNDETIQITIELSNFSGKAISGSLQWSLVSKGLQLNGEIAVPVTKNGQITVLGQLQVDVEVEDIARQWTLTVQLGEIENNWNLWTYPYPKNTHSNHSIRSQIQLLRPLLPNADYRDDFGGHMLTFDRTEPQLDKSTDLAITDRLSLRLLQYLHDGGLVWLMPRSDQIYDYVRTRYLPPFWSYLHFPDNVSSVMGMIINDHSVLQDFPHDGFSNWQWYDLVNNAPAISLDAQPNLQPIVEVVDNFNRAKRLTYAFETQIGKGRLFVSTWQLSETSVIGRPEAAFLFHQVVDYLTSDSFVPTIYLSVAQLLSLFKLTNNRESILE